MSHLKDSLKSGKVMLLDLISGVEVTTEIKEVNDDHVVVGKMIVFQLSVDPNSGQARVGAMPFGSPFAITQPDEVPISYNHIIFVHDPKEDIEKAYLQATSGIQLAGAGALNDLDAARAGQPGIIR